MRKISTLLLCAVLPCACDIGQDYRKTYTSVDSTANHVSVPYERLLFLNRPWQYNGNLAAYSRHAAVASFIDLERENRVFHSYLLLDRIVTSSINSDAFLLDFGISLTSMKLDGIPGLAILGDTGVVVMSSGLIYPRFVNQFPRDEQPYSYVHYDSGNKIGHYKTGELFNSSFQVTEKLISASYQTGQEFEVFGYSPVTKAARLNTYSVPWDASEVQVVGVPSLVTDMSSYEDLSDEERYQRRETATQLLAMSPMDGRYALYERAATDSDIFGAADSWCPGLAGVGNGTVKVRALGVDKFFPSVAYVGDEQGVVRAIDTGNCVPFTELPQLSLGSTAAVTHLAVNDLLEITVGQMDGSVHVLSYMGAVLTLLEDYSRVCDYPVYSQLLDDRNYVNSNKGYLLLACNDWADPQDSKSTNVFADYFRFILINRDNGDVLSNFTIDRTTSAGIGVIPYSEVHGPAPSSADPYHNVYDGARLFNMIDGAFGTLEVWDLFTGKKIKQTDLYTKTVLQQ